MSARRVFAHAIAFTAFASVLLFAQTKRGASLRSVVHEFPVTMRQNVVAGTTPVGTKVEAKLTIATLVDGTVIPAGATFSGEVVESAAKSATTPSRLAIRMNSVGWKERSAPIKVYLTAWYYPVLVATTNPTNDDMPSVSTPIPSPGRTRKGTGGAGPNGSGTPQRHAETAGLDWPNATSSTLSDTRVVIKDIDSTHQSDGALALTSTRFNIKLDKTTTYVLATADLTPSR